MKDLPFIQKNLFPVGVMAISLIVGAWFFHAYVIRIEIPKKIKLADCTNSPVKIYLKAPAGRKYFLVLDTPQIEVATNGKLISSYTFSGRIRIAKDNKVIADMPIASDHALLTMLNNADSPYGYELTGFSEDTNMPSLSGLVQARANYDLEINFNPTPPPSSSIWLHWLQTAKDQKQ